MAHNRREVYKNDRVYLIRGDDGLKIGKAQVLDRRLAQLKRQYGNIELIAAVHGYTQLENHLHYRFEKYRKYVPVQSKRARAIRHLGGMAMYPTDWFEPAQEIFDWFNENGILRTRTDKKAS